MMWGEIWCLKCCLLWCLIANELGKVMGKVMGKVSVFHKAQCTSLIVAIPRIASYAGFCYSSMCFSIFSIINIEKQWGSILTADRNDVL